MEDLKKFVVCKGSDINVGGEYEGSEQEDSILVNSLQSTVHSTQIFRSRNLKPKVKVTNYKSELYGTKFCYEIYHDADQTFRLMIIILPMPIS